MTFNQEIGVTSGGDHPHLRSVDMHGNGNTDIAIGEHGPHRHIIVEGTVQPAGADEHTHDDVPFAMKGQQSF